ncbi:MAG: hypothetical protein R6U17_03315 [Thermoplasmata archaeon]
MKMWKKLMAFATALLLISAIMAAQYVSVSTDATLSVDTQYAGLQIAAHDPATAPGTAHNYTLERTASGFQVNLGTWGEQNTFISTRAFMIVNAGANNIQIVNVSVSSTGDDIGPYLNIYLVDGDQNTSSDGGDRLSVWNGADVDFSGSPYYLGYVADPYQGEYLNITLDTDEYGNATWEESSDGGERLWYTNPGNDGIVAWGGADVPNSNAVWVYIEVDLSGATDGTTYDGTLQFDVREA